VFLDHFNTLILKIILKDKKKYYFNIFLTLKNIRIIYHPYQMQPFQQYGCLRHLGLLVKARAFWETKLIQTFQPKWLSY
jgi:hypothetical protein